MTRADIAARYRRLEELSLGLALEIQIFSKPDDPMLWHERQAYLTAIRDARAGIESARVTLAKAGQRLYGAPWTRNIPARSQ